MLSRTEAGSTPTNRHYLLDALKTPIALLTQDGAISARTSYDAWGEIRRQQGTNGAVSTPGLDSAIANLIDTDGQPIGFTGYVKDDESGLYYAKARYYDPTVARFTTEDPEAGNSTQPPSLHRYLYAYGNPTVWRDPAGRCGTQGDEDSCLQNAGAALDWSGERVQEERSVQYAAEQRAALPSLAGIALAPLIVEVSGLGGAIFGDTLATGSLWSGLTLNAAGLSTTGLIAAETTAAIATGTMAPSVFQLSLPAASASIERAQAQVATKLEQATATVVETSSAKSALSIRDTSAQLDAKLNEIQSYVVSNGSTPNPWNEFQKATSGQFASRGDAAEVYRANQSARAGVDPASVTARAQGWQGTGRYPGVDRYRDIALKEGVVIFGGEPGQSAYYTTGRTLERYGNDATAIAQALQFASYKGTYRPGMTAYRVTREVPAAFGRARANPQFGPGGAHQIYLPNYEDVLEPLYSIPLINREVPSP